MVKAVQPLRRVPPFNGPTGVRLTQDQFMVKAAERYRIHGSGVDGYGRSF